MNYAYGNTGWKDLLTSYNGQSITYDTIGNPLSYRGMTLTWQNGRQLATLTKSGKTTSYEYDINGRRTKKVANGVTTEYYYSGEQYTGMHTSDGKDVGAILDASGSLYGIYYDDSTIGTDVGQTYYFVYNGQGDVIGLYNHGGKLIATYAYDAWGRCIEAKAVTADDDGHAVTDPDHIAFINPFRYRGYYYDTESGLYYLNSRYYDPETGRFLNADGQLSTGSDLTGMNLFAYCGNNPVNRTDSSGEAWWHWVAAVAVVAVCAVAVVATAGGAAAGLAAVAAVGNGVAAATTASTVAAGAFIGSATALGMAAATAVVTSHNAQEFADQGGPALMSTATGAVLGGASGYVTAKSTPQKSVPNPNGKKGGPAHQAEIAKQTAMYNPNQVKTEVKIETPGGMKPYRYADFSVTENGETWYGNVGRQLQSGLPCARERYAIADIESTGRTIRFFPYN